MIGTLVGFLGGIYIPIGALSEVIGNMMKCTPIIYGTAMFRRVMTQEIVNTTFQGIPEEVVSEYCTAMGISLEIFDKKIGVIYENYDRDSKTRRRG